MNPQIKELSDRIHELYEQIMVANPWDDGYGEVVAIHEYLMKTLRDRAQKDYEEFKVHLAQAARDIEETWSSNKSHLAKWTAKVRPVFEKIADIIPTGVKLLALL